VRVAAADGLSHAGADAIAALPMLVEGVRDHEAQGRPDLSCWLREWPALKAYSHALRNVGAHAPSRMFPLLADGSEGVREAAAGVLVRHLVASAPLPAPVADLAPHAALLRAALPEIEDRTARRRVEERLDALSSSR
jgi:hypothetical protein